ncbi:MAG: hypothetical protein DYH06_02010, partial [Acidobacteria bacterium ACB2]|nr:hypothetical protein [Acidobacteria bacterium ACB2]
RACQEQQVRARDGVVGQEDRPSVGQDGQEGRDVWGQQPAGVAGAGAGETAPLDGTDTRGRTASASPRARSGRTRRTRRIGIARRISKLRARARPSPLG